MVSYSFITSRLATGGRLEDPTDVEILIDAGLTHVIDCTQDSYESTAAFAQHPALAVLWNPTPDDGQPKGVEWFEESLDFAFMSLAKPQGRLYCHCDQGLNRGPSTAFCVMLALGWIYDEAIDMIHKARPQTIGSIRYAADAANALYELGYL